MSHPKTPPGTCSIDECDSVEICRGWCEKHYSRWKAYGTPTPSAEPRTCVQCGIMFTPPFGRGAAATNKCSDECRTMASRKRSAAQRLADPVKANIATRTAKVKIAYGISLAEYESIMFEARCAICEKTTDLNLDHDHETGALREVLCGSCNRGLGLFNDDFERLEKAKQYLMKHANLRLVAT